MGNTLATMQRDLSAADTVSRTWLPIVSTYSTTRLGTCRLCQYPPHPTDLLRLTVTVIPIIKVLNKYTHIGVAVAENDLWIQGVKDTVRSWICGLDVGWTSWVPSATGRTTTNFPGLSSAVSVVPSDRVEYMRNIIPAAPVTF